MRKTRLLMEKLWLDGIRFVKSEDLKTLCRQLNVKYDDMIRYLLSRGYLIRVFRGVFYVKTIDEIRFKRTGITYLKLVAEGLKIKGVENWYFGLYTALRLNNITHEYYPVDFILNDKIFRAREIRIANHKFRFIKLKSSLFFGIREEDGIKYSNLEKTILDFIYLWRYKGIPEKRIILDISELVNKASKKKLTKYSKKYPKTVRKTLEIIYERIYRGNK